MLRADFGVGIFRGWTIHAVAPSGAYEMEWIAKALRNPNARITDVVYLLYFYEPNTVRRKRPREETDNWNRLATVIGSALSA